MRSDKHRPCVLLFCPTVSSKAWEGSPRRFGIEVRMTW